MPACSSKFKICGVRCLRLLLVSALLSGACGTAKVEPAAVRPACDLWGQVKDSLRAGEPQVIFVGDSIQTEAEESGVREFAELATDLNNAFTEWLLLEAEAGGAPTPDFVEAARAFDTYCADHGAPTGEPLAPRADDASASPGGSGELLPDYDIFEEALEQGTDPPRWQISEEACRSYIRQEPIDPGPRHALALSLLSRPRLTADEASAAIDALGFMVALGAETVECLKTYGRLPRGDEALTWSASWLLLANTRLQDPVLEEIATVSMNHTIDRYPRSPCTIVANFWVHADAVPEVDEFTAGCSLLFITYGLDNQA